MEIVVPGSVANLGGGFDTLGVAVQLYLRARVVDVSDDGGGKVRVASSRPAVTGPNALERAYSYLAAKTGRPAPTVTVDVESEIPMAAGLGSSAAAAVAGLRLFERMVGGHTGSRSEERVSASALVKAATELEGHADNAAAAIHGGLTSVVEVADGEVEVLHWRWPDELQLVVATPQVGLATVEARAALSAQVPRRDAVFNLQRVLAFVHALEHRRFGALREAMQDRWHQPARMALVPELAEVLALDDPDVLGACLAGAGPSVALLARSNVGRVEHRLREIYERMGRPATIRSLRVHQSDVAVAASAHGRT